MRRYFLSSSLDRRRSTNSWNSFAVEAEVWDIYNRVPGLCSLPLAGIFYGSSDKGHFVVTPSAPCPELAWLECVNCCEQKDAYVLSTPWLCIDSLWRWYQNCECFLWTVCSQTEDTAVGLLCSRGRACEAGEVENDELHSPSSLGGSTSTGHKVPFVCLGPCPGH